MIYMKDMPNISCGLNISGKIPWRSSMIEISGCCSGFLC